MAAKKKEGGSRPGLPLTQCSLFRNWLAVFLYSKLVFRLGVAGLQSLRWTFSGWLRQASLMAWLFCSQRSVVIYPCLGRVIVNSNANLCDVSCECPNYLVIDLVFCRACFCASLILVSKIKTQFETKSVLGGSI